ncbi:hypothetical protein GCM10007387_58330 [Pseudoduganella albidiflava]|uniref:DUF4123 domain-containing protein n=1 Tax=Pseudoduganella albidiflava TaxID=321983 RepID=A0AA87Y3C0_9BURK|nr:hypothetical protein GCM10007387_58330 [Pseudoduganella albidiflava]
MILPDGETMFFAFWDPAVLGTLVGQEDDFTLHVPGPVLTLGQQANLSEIITTWWYWDRAGIFHTIALPRQLPEAARAPFHLDQAQVDSLVEASLPDHLLYFVRLNQPHLLDAIPELQQYRIVCAALQSARSIGLEQMRDLVNYVCLMLFYKDEMLQDQVILVLLDRVRNKEISFDEAMQLFP